MPYGRRRYRTKRRYRKRTLGARSIKSRTSARSQSKQILSLSRRLKRVARNTYENMSLHWQRNNLAIGTATGMIQPYICPLPYAPCDPNATSPLTPSAQRFADNRQIASQQFFTKRHMFGRSANVDESLTYFHTGGTLRYQMYTQEVSFNKVTLALIRPKKHLADQLTVDRALKGIAAVDAAGSAAFLANDVDYLLHDGAGGSVSTTFGCKINTKYWDVLYKREIALSVPNGVTLSETGSGANQTPANNSLIASGTIKLPAGGIVQQSGHATQETIPDTSPAAEMQFIDQKNEKSVYLVAFLNDATLDAETVKMGFIVQDNYKCIV